MTLTEIMKTEKQKQITTIMKKSTNNYERPEVQVVHVETEAGFASNGNEGYGATIRDFNYDEDETLGC